MAEGGRLIRMLWIEEAYPIASIVLGVFHMHRVCSALVSLASICDMFYKQPSFQHIEAQRQTFNSPSGAATQGQQYK